MHLPRPVLWSLRKSISRTLDLESMRRDKTDLSLPNALIRTITINIVSLACSCVPETRHRIESSIRYEGMSNRMRNSGEHDDDGSHVCSVRRRARDMATDAESYCRLPVRHIAHMSATTGSYKLTRTSAIACLRFLAHRSYQTGKDWSGLAVVDALCTVTTQSTIRSRARHF